MLEGEGRGNVTSLPSLWGRIVASPCMFATLEVWTLRQQYAVRPLPGRDWEMGILGGIFCLFVLSPGGIATASVHMPIKNCFFVCYSLVGLLDMSLIGFQR